MSKFKVGDIVKWYINPYQYLTGKVTEVCDNDTYWVEHSNGQERKYKESELILHE